MDMFTYQEKLFGCFRGVERVVTVNEQGIIGAFLRGEIGSDDFLALMIASGYTHAASLMCLVNNFAVPT